MTARPRPSLLRIVSGALSAVLVVAYPVAVYFGLTRLGTRQVGLLLLGLVGLRLLLQLPSQRREHLREILKGPAIILGLVLLSIAADDHRFLLVMPVLISLVLLGSFGATLREGRMPMVERFARMQVDELSEAELRYCRSVTQVWCAFFIFNAAMAGGLALFAPLAWWALYTGLIAYLLIGSVFAVEIVVRKARFRRYGDGLHDRVFAWLLPPRVT